MPISQKQIEDWCESEVTLHFLKLVKKRLDETFRQRSEAFFPYEPMKTQEAKAHLIGAEGAFDELIEVISERDFSQLEEPEDERVRNTPLPGPGVN